MSELLGKNKPEEDRPIKIKNKDGKFVDYDFHNLKTGDIWKFIDDDTVYIALSDAYITHVPIYTYEIICEPCLEKIE